ncbi:MAG TPA: protein-L-isoaspartate(D-aspartate) O-methyltransferase [Kofleriaceae bacterium]|nr:protein-L-isoaspartate(D-aspartate) O-methyltransferase [Kofleriaceae bacterium]
MIRDQLAQRGIRDERVLAAFAAVPRELFVSDEQRDLAYADSPLPIGYGQTISQPYVVALTVQALALRGDERVLEVGTGSGYAAAILGALAREVITIERIAELAAAAAVNLRRANITNVTVHVGDGTLGWAPGAPYDAIAVAANAPSPPRSLLEQLAIGGRLVLPYGYDDHQRLVKITREAERFVETDLGAVRFVPLVGAEGW